MGLSRSMKFHQYRLKLGYTQPELAEALGYNVAPEYQASFISRKEHGHKAVTDDDLWLLEEMMINAGLAIYN